MPTNSCLIQIRVGEAGEGKSQVVRLTRSINDCVLRYVRLVKAGHKSMGKLRTAYLTRLIICGVSRRNELFRLHIY